MTIPTTHDIQFGVPFGEAAISFYLFLTAAMAIVFFFCRNKFGEFCTEENDDDYVSQLSPRYLARHEEYSKGLVIYVGTMVFVVFVLSLAGPKPLSFLGVTVSPEFSYASVPLVIALMMVGILPNVPVLQELERWLRRLAHERAFIPTAARETAERLAAAEFDFSSYRHESALASAEMRGVDFADFAAPPHSLEHSWARLSCLAYGLAARRMSGDLAALDGELLRRYAKHLDGIDEQRKALETEIALYRKEKSTNAAYTDYALHRRVRDTLYRLYILLGCAVRLKVKLAGDIGPALHPFGFKFKHTPPPYETRYLKFVGIAVMAASVLVVGLAALAAPSLRLWAVSQFFPNTWYQPFFDTAAAIILHGSAIVAADIIRAHFIKRRCWFSSERRRPVAVNYVAVAFACGLVGFVGSTLWGLAFAPITVAWLKASSASLLLPAATGAFYVYHLDNVELHRRPSSLQEVVWQGAVTALCGLVAASWFWRTVLDDSLPVDQIILMTATGAAVGASFGWYIPHAAASMKYRPFAEPREDRSRILEPA